MSGQPLSLSLRIIIGFHLVNLVLWFFGQMGAFFWYDTAASWGLQESRQGNDPAVIQNNIGTGLADTFIAFPLFAMAAWGLWRRKFYGVVCSWMVFYHSLYWPMVYWMSCLMYKQGNILHTPMTVPNVLIPGFIWCFAVWGSWYLCRREKNVLIWLQSETSGQYEVVE